jgi:hypothetical protein
MEHCRRRVSDWIRLALGAALLGVLTAHSGEPTPFERDVARAVQSFPDALESPVRHIAYALLGAGVYMACIAALGGSVNFWTSRSLNIFIGTIASLIPIPGGSTAVSTAGMSGALAAAGVPIETAVAAALLNLIVWTYIPAIVGWFATRDLLDDDYL